MQMILTKRDYKVLIVNQLQTIEYAIVKICLETW